MDPDNPCANCHPGPNGAGVPCPCPFTHMAFHETGTVFVDTRPGVPPSQLYKMVANAQHPKHKDKTGTYALASPDGFGNWTFMSELPALAGSDTCNVGWWCVRMPAPLERLLRFGSKVCAAACLRSGTKSTKST
eukprot:COSAG04_NODE_1918_length_5203_cov_2.179902_6_plen_134_part_00